ncbi:MAG: hypothetical protein ACRDTG_28535 [Pseudonocardiaceae bacterium]
MQPVPGEAEEARLIESPDWMPLDQQTAEPAPDPGPEPTEE